jgi:hypothetical protein
MKIRGDEPFLALRVYVKMSEIHETGRVADKKKFLSDMYPSFLAMGGIIDYH